VSTLRWAARLRAVSCTYAQSRAIVGSMIETRFRTSKQDDGATLYTPATPWAWGSPNTRKIPVLLGIGRKATAGVRDRGQREHREPATSCGGGVLLAPLSSRFGWAKDGRQNRAIDLRAGPAARRVTLISPTIGEEGCCSPDIAPACVPCDMR